MTLNAVHHNDHQSGEPTMYSPTRRAAKALAGLVIAAGLALDAGPPARAASPGEGATVKQIHSEKLPPARHGSGASLSEPDLGALVRKRAGAEG